MYEQDKQVNKYSLYNYNIYLAIQKELVMITFTKKIPTRGRGKAKD